MKLFFLLSVALIVFQSVYCPPPIKTSTQAPTTISTIIDTTTQAPPIISTIVDTTTQAPPITISDKPNSNGGGGGTVTAPPAPQTTSITKQTISSTTPPTRETFMEQILEYLSQFMQMIRALFSMIGL